MPELPEVETVKRIIEPQIKGQRIETVVICNEQIVAHPSTEKFAAYLDGQVIAGMGRRGKFLLFRFENEDRLYLHLRMTGQLLVAPSNCPVEKHTHLILCLSGGEQLRYVDPRRFGRFWYIRNGESVAVTGIEKLGLEPTDERLTGMYLQEKLGKKNKPIKELLLDQSVVAGIGNIYSDEILYEACIHPEEKCCELSGKEWKKLAEIIPKAVLFFTEKNAITPEDYLKSQGKDYRNTPYLRVYGHAGRPCPVCGATFEKITVAGRSSTFCPQCQRRHA